MDISRCFVEQAGVISRPQVLEAGMGDADIERMLRRREWVRVFPGVYVDHTGPMTWLQRAWAATLVHRPSALAAGSALQAYGVRSAPASDAITLIVPVHARVVDPPGVRTTRSRAFDALVHPTLLPRRVRLEAAALAVASGAPSEDAAVALLADVCQQGRTTPERLSAALATQPRLPRRRLLGEILDDVATGSYSALERRYLSRVERAHGLPQGGRQRRVRPGRRAYYRDVEYAGLGVVVELDGRLGHESALDRWLDLERDLTGLLLGDVTVRIGWGQVLEPCRLATSVAGVLAARGWIGRAASCGDSCQVPQP